MANTKEKIKRLFNSYIVQVLSSIETDSRDLWTKKFEGTVMKDLSDSTAKTDILYYDIYDFNDVHYGTITVEITYDNRSNVLDYVQWAQFYGVANAVEFEDLEDCVYDMIEFRDKFTERNMYSVQNF